ncbi:restriction endonuclease subunit S [Xanthomonas oryzae]|uniref:restriction endonuclease subunit S n=1 Tax=Xanthomonas oryzae TaxID=347 RepID=UPI002DE57504|nr:restriction endonuclease subunit S [Xanthomonas oryzae]MEC5077327.1 restriction endonuclease subunit S [Xanthomonas oryzae pv. oryzicola]MEC5112755.1 restriction endonuclease subunit S [Xanthomonas oryzae pv. oryzicola]
MSELPGGWTSCQLGDLLDHIQAGKNVKCDERPPEGEEPGLVKISAVTWGKFDELESKTLLSDDGLEARNKIQPGDLLISRANTLELVGAPVIVHAITKNLYLSDKVLRLDLAEPLRAWALTCLKSKSGRSQIEALATGNQLSMRNISQDALRSIELPLPPLAEQKRIAQKLDALLAQVDTLKARIDAIPTLLKRFRRSVLTAALSGELTEQWRNDHPQEDWVSVKIGSICKLKSGVAISADHEKSAGDAPYFKVGEMNRPGNELFLQHTDRYLMTADAPSRAIMPRGSILFPKRGGAIATNKKRVLKEPSFVDLNIMGIIVPDGVEVMYVYRWLETIDLGKLNTGSTIPQVNNSDIAPLLIPIPSREEQTEIVRRVEQLFAYANQLEAKVAAAQQRIDALTQSLLAKAFRGELVPQNPTDEPASMLLERIRAQRAAAPKPKRGRKAATS